MTGSSPLARGLPQEVNGEPGENRIIPARAGFTSDDAVKKLADQDHPRSRGVYGAWVWSSILRTGSSPLARGLRSILERNCDCYWIIPARAGFTRWGCNRARRWSDHPRSRGVYVLYGVQCAFHCGSSPLARGLLARRRPRVEPARIIPARAGFTSGVAFPDRAR